ncbi:hypothetical protein B0H19DRAFT_1069520 [Mycena capillaripes]|nr:hypothetical protein B0H19DRAFT_1069520 [Mycena capillaripes]
MSIRHNLRKVWLRFRRVRRPSRRLPTRPSGGCSFFKTDGYVTGSPVNPYPAVDGLTVVAEAHMANFFLMNFPAFTPVETAVTGSTDETRPSGPLRVTVYGHPSSGQKRVFFRRSSHLKDRSEPYRKVPEAQRERNNDTGRGGGGSGSVLLLPYELTPLNPSMFTANDIADCSVPRGAGYPHEELNAISPSGAFMSIGSEMFSSLIAWEPLACGIQMRPARE